MSVQDLLNHRAIPESQDERVRAALARGTWCWPVEGSGWAWRNAISFRADGPPVGRPGQALLVTTGESMTSLWCLDLGGIDPANVESGREFVQKAREAWNRCVDALPRSIFALWSSMDSMRGLPLRAFFLDARADRQIEQFSGALGVLDGPSFGLSFALAMASRMLGVVVPESVAATGAVDALGRVSEVGQIARKVRAIQELAPRVRTLFVASDDLKEAQAANAGRLDIQPVDTLYQLLVKVFGEGTLERDFAGTTDPMRRKTVVEALFRLALGDRRAVVDWSPVERAAVSAVTHWDLHGFLRFQAETAAAIAARHERNGGIMPPFLSEWQARLPVSVRLDLVAQHVQQAADTGTPGLRAAEELVTANLARGKDAFPGHLRILGSWSRLLWVTGRPADALERAREAVEGWLECMQAAQADRPLCVWMRLAGALGDVASMAAAEKALDAINRDLGTRQESTNEFVRLAWAIARFQLDGPIDSVLEAFAGLSPEGGRPNHVSCSAMRWLALAHHRRGSGDLAAEMLARLDQPLIDDESLARSARINRLLVDLELCPDQSRDGEHIRELKDLEPGVVGHLLRSAVSTGKEPGPYIVRFYPY